MGGGTIWEGHGGKGLGERVSHAAVWQKRVLDRNGKCKGPEVKVWQAGGQRGGQVSRAE